MRYFGGIVAAAVLSCGVGLVGCGGGGGETAASGGTVSASGRFVVRDVTPKDLFPVEATSVRSLQVTSVAPNGLIAANVSRAVSGSATPYGGVVPVLIDLDRQSVTRLQYSGAGTPTPLENGFASVISARGDVYGVFQQGTTTISYTPFQYSRATGQTTVRPSLPFQDRDLASGQSGISGISDAGQFLLQRYEVTDNTSGTVPSGGTIISDLTPGNALLTGNVSTSVINYASPATTERRIESPEPGYNAQGQFINRDGVVAGRLYSRSGTTPSPLPDRVFTWKDGVATVLPALTDGDLSVPYAISNTGMVVGLSVRTDRTLRIVTWKNGAVTALPAPPLPFNGLTVLSTNTQGDILALLTTVPTPGTSSPPILPGEFPAPTQYTHVLWRNRTQTWLDLTPEAKDPTMPTFPYALLDDGRVVATSTFKLYTLTPR